MAGVRALLALRGTLFLRRHGTPLDALVVGGTLGAGWLVGRILAREVPATSGQAAGALALALGAVVLAAATPVAHTLLFRARELALLLVQPIGERELVLLRLAELSATSAVGLAVVAALLGGASASFSFPGAAVAVALGAPLLGGAELLLAWLWRRTLGSRPRAARTAAIGTLASCTALLALAVAFPRESRATLGGLSLAIATPLQPGASFIALVRGLDPIALGALALEGLAVAGLAVALVPRGLGAAIDAAAVRPVGERGLAFRLAGAIAAPLPGPARALVRRDLALLARGAFPRGVLVLTSLSLGLLVFREATLDRELASQGLVPLAALFVEGALASVAAFLFGVDFPRERAAKLVWERAQPLAGKHVLWARAFEAALPATALALALGAIAALGPPAVAERALDVALSCTLLGLACSHHGAAFGLSTEGRGGEFVEAAGFPVAAGFLAVAGALALSITSALSGFPWGALAYPIVYRGLGARAALQWEHAEVGRSYD